MSKIAVDHEDLVNPHFRAGYLEGVLSGLVEMIGRADAAGELNNKKQLRALVGLLRTTANDAARAACDARSRG